jgi:hypothetical protein
MPLDQKGVLPAIDHLVILKRAMLAKVAGGRKARGISFL